ncbi:MAG: DNA replication and repair protein RecF [Steroidobacteraceae bacterium]
MLQRFEAHHFRCFERAVLPAEGRSIGLVGPNASGKTSILEALHFLSYGRSFRVNDRQQLIQTGSRGFRLTAHVSDAAGPSDLSARYVDGQLSVEVSGRPAASIGELAGRIRAHLIDPSVHRLIEGIPQERRRLLDTGVFHVEPIYLAHWRQYRRVLRQRNAGLRNSLPLAQIAAWDAQLCDAAIRVDQTRASYVQQWSKVFRSAAAAFGLMDASLDYRRGWAQGAELGTALAESSARDLNTGITSVGPHRADVAVVLGGRSARRVVSRGQQKLLASALVLSQLKLVQAAGQEPLLLLDDPGAELDVDNLGRFLAVIGELPVQIIATATFPAALEALPQLAMFHVKQGGLEPML